MDSTFFKWDSENHQIKIETITDHSYVGTHQLEVRIRVAGQEMRYGELYWP